MIYGYLIILTSYLLIINNTVCLHVRQRVNQKIGKSILPFYQLYFFHDNYFILNCIIGYSIIFSKVSSPKSFFTNDNPYKNNNNPTPAQAYFNNKHTQKYSDIYSQDQMPIFYNYNGRQNYMYQRSTPPQYFSNQQESFKYQLPNNEHNRFRKQIPSADRITAFFNRSRNFRF